jgi:hypothetical protein
VPPRQRHQPRRIVVREKTDLVASPQLRRSHEQPRVLALEQAAVAERVGVDPRHAAAADLDAYRLAAGLVANRPHRLRFGPERRDFVEIADVIARDGVRGRFARFLDDHRTRVFVTVIGGFRRVVHVRPGALNARPAFEIALAVDDGSIDDQTAAGFDPPYQRVASAPAQAPVKRRDDDHGVR